MSAADRCGVTLSLLDRLTDFEPGAARERPLGQAEAIRRHMDAVCRDLSALLNTRRAPAGFDAAYKHSAASILTYGIADFTTFNLAEGGALEEIRDSIERAIRLFEPRLDRAAVSAREVDPAGPVFEFQVSALLRVEGGAEPVLLDVKLRRDSRRVSVSGAD